MTLKDKIVLITGATGGLGAAVTRRFLKENAKVLAVYRRQGAYEELRKSLENTTGLEGFSIDLSDTAEVKKLFTWIEKKYAGIDIALHLAGGFLMKGNIWETPEEDWLKMLEMNLNTTFRLARESFRIMTAKGRGHFIAVGSRAARDLPKGMGAYAVSKAAMLALIKTLAKESMEFGVNVNAVIPGTIDTPANREAMPEADFSLWIQPEEIAETLLQLVQNNTVTGSLIELKGR